MHNPTVLLPDGERRPIADNQIPYHLKCPIDGTQLAEQIEYDFTGYSCVTCNSFYSVRRGRISQEELDESAKSRLKEAGIRIIQLDDEKGKLLRLLELAEQNSFKF